MMRLRSGLIGSMSAWLPSRRSTAHQRGACVDALVGPGAVGQVERDLLVERDVLLDRHARGLLGVDHVLSPHDSLQLAYQGLSRATRTPRRGAADLRPRRGSEGGGAVNARVEGMPRGRHPSNVRTASPTIRTTGRVETRGPSHPPVGCRHDDPTGHPRGHQGGRRRPRLPPVGPPAGRRRHPAAHPGRPARGDLRRQGRPVPDHRGRGQAGRRRRRWSSCAGCWRPRPSDRSWRVGLRHAGADPREELRATVPDGRRGRRDPRAPRPARPRLVDRALDPGDPGDHRPLADGPRAGAGRRARARHPELQARRPQAQGARAHRVARHRLPAVAAGHRGRRRRVRRTANGPTDRTGRALPCRDRRPRHAGAARRGDLDARAGARPTASSG